MSFSESAGRDTLSVTSLGYSGFGRQIIQVTSCESTGRRIVTASAALETLDWTIRKSVSAKSRTDSALLGSVQKRPATRHKHRFMMGWHIMCSKAPW